MRAFAIGSNKKAADEFCALLRESGARPVLDIRLYPTSPPWSHASAHKLKPNLREHLGMDYVHEPRLAPSRELFKDWKSGEIDWNTYAKRFRALMQEREVQSTVPRDRLADSCLLCVCQHYDRCHRSLVVEHLTQQWGDLEVTQLG